jgi:membrane protein implicated in regulation of membrane protease activity
MTLLNLLADFGAWNWLFLGVALFTLEALVPGVHFVWFGVAAVMIGIAGLATGMTWPWQLVAFAVLTVATVFVARRFAGADAVPSDAPNLNMRGAQYVGRLVTVEEPIRGGRGKVRVGDTVWQAEGADAPAGARVKVTGIRGTVLVVAQG